MKKINAVVIDDEIKSREVIKTLIANFCENVHVVGEAGDIVGGVAIINEKQPDLVFLDITLKEGDSFQILEQISPINFDIIFVTAYDEYSVKALTYSGIKCLFKPLDIDEFVDAIKVVAARPTDMGLAYEMVDGILKSKFRKIPIITSTGLKFTDVAEITYIEQNDQGVTIHCRNGDMVNSQRGIKEFKDIIFNARFTSLGARLLVNTTHVDFSHQNAQIMQFRNDEQVKLTKEESLRFLELTK